MFEIVKNEIVLFYEKVLLDFFEMEKEWIEVEIYKVKCLVYIDIDDIDILLVFVVGVVFVMFFVWVFVFVVGIVFGIVFVGFGIILGLVVFLMMKFFGRDVRKKKMIDKEYNKCYDKIKSMISDVFELNYGCVINKLIDKVIEDMFFK